MWHVFIAGFCNQFPFHFLSLPVKWLVFLQCICCPAEANAVFYSYLKSCGSKLFCYICSSSEHQINWSFSPVENMSSETFFLLYAGRTFETLIFQAFGLVSWNLIHKDESKRARMAGKYMGRRHEYCRLFCRKRTCFPTSMYKSLWQIMWYVT